jgi:DNA-binding MarR family transcriptional regulator
MNEIKATVAEQLQHLQMLMQRTFFRGFAAGGRMRDPHRGQGRILAMLKMKPEISQRELTYLLGTSKQSLAESLVKLEKSGCITREPSGEDKRVMIIKLTDDGKKAADFVDFENETGAAEKILDCLTDDELTAFSGYLGRVIKRYEELFPGPDYEGRRRYMERFMSRYGHGRGFEGFDERGNGADDTDGRFDNNGRFTDTDGRRGEHHGRRHRQW